jgi:hypothetical protein
VDLDKQIEHEMQKSHVDPKPVAIAIDEESKTSSTQSPQVAGPPGVAAQGAVQPNQPVATRSGASGANSDEETSKSTVRNVTSQNLEHTRIAGMLPNRIHRHPQQLYRTGLARAQ